MSGFFFESTAKNFQGKSSNFQQDSEMSSDEEIVLSSQQGSDEESVSGSQQGSDEESVSGSQQSSDEESVSGSQQSSDEESVSGSQQSSDEESVSVSRKDSEVNSDFFDQENQEARLRIGTLGNFDFSNFLKLDLEKNRELFADVYKSKGFSVSCIDRNIMLFSEPLYRNIDGLIKLYTENSYSGSVPFQVSNFEANFSQGAPKLEIIDTEINENAEGLVLRTDRQEISDTGNSREVRAVLSDSLGEISSQSVSKIDESQESDK
ncbi:hypothetical protein HE1_00210 [Holospora elegans E1]|uniref:Uncharacterized protein n=1 Tax=Holospora elegans E1 TaxID=1427503 RepID=A0A023DX39_9PROT|nr:hypothetical protein [Holospora elegans]GAJ45893.1 hypothetical protein HE1_00210 [Holospora elegans E1]